MDNFHVFTDETPNAELPGLWDRRIAVLPRLPVFLEVKLRGSCAGAILPGMFRRGFGPAESSKLHRNEDGGGGVECVAAISCTPPKWRRFTRASTDQAGRHHRLISVPSPEHRWVLRQIAGVPRNACMTDLGIFRCTAYA